MSCFVAGFRPAPRKPATKARIYGAGEHDQQQDTKLQPRPAQQPRIPIWAGGWWPNKPPMRRAAPFDAVHSGATSGDDLARDAALVASYAAFGVNCWAGGECVRVGKLGLCGALCRAHTPRRHGAGALSLGQWGWAIASGLVCYALAYWWNSIGLRRTPATVASLFLNVVPLVTVGDGYLFLGERLAPLQGVGAALILSVALGVGLLSKAAPDWAYS